MRLGSHYVPLRVLVGWLAGFLVLLFEILGLPTCTRKTQYTTGLPAHFLWCLDAEEDWQGRRGPGCCLGTSRGSVLGSASQGLTPSSSRDLQSHVQNVSAQGSPLGTQRARFSSVAAHRGVDFACLGSRLPAVQTLSREACVLHQSHSLCKPSSQAGTAECGAPGKQSRLIRWSLREPCKVKFPEASRGPAPQAGCSVSGLPR